MGVERRGDRFLARVDTTRDGKRVRRRVGGFATYLEAAIAADVYSPPLLPLTPEQRARVARYDRETLRAEMTDDILHRLLDKMGRLS
jgi:hypothetical protein